MKCREAEPEPGQVIAFDQGIKRLSVRVNEQGCFSHIGVEASPNAIQEELGPGKSHGAIKQLMWRMPEQGLLIAAEGKYRRNEGIPAANDAPAQSRVTRVTAVTPVTAVTHETATANEATAAGVAAIKGENPVTDETDAPERDGNRGNTTCNRTRARPGSTRTH